MTTYLSAEDAERIHATILKNSGGLDGLRDRNLLLSALDAPKATFSGHEMYPTIADKAATYLYHLIKNHPFNDGNKRTAYVVVFTFLEANDVQPHFTKEELEEAAVLVAENQMSKGEVLTFFRGSYVSSDRG